MPRPKIIAACLLLCGSALTALWAHDLYLLPDMFYTHKGANLKVSFHNGDSFPTSEVAPKPERLHDAYLFGPDGQSAVTDLHIVGNETWGSVNVSSSGTLLLSVQTVPNFIELQPDKFYAYLKEEGLDDVIAWRKSHEETSKPGRERYTKYAKSVVQSDSSNGFYNHSLGFPLEIVPLVSPDLLHAGAALPVRVMHLGKPVAGLQVEAAWAADGHNKTIVVGRTREDGVISVPSVSAGLWRLHTLKMERCSDPAIADWESTWASLTFEGR